MLNLSLRTLVVVSYVWEGMGSGRALTGMSHERREAPKILSRQRSRGHALKFSPRS